MKNNTDYLLKEISVFRNKISKENYLNAYDKTLKLWPVQYDEFYIESRVGKIHILASGNLKSPPLLLFHGIGISSTMWHPNIRDLSEHYRVYALDIPGDIGKSILRKRPLSRKACAQWIVDAMDALNIQQAVIVGLSLGGWFSFNFTYYFPTRVSKLILLSPAAVFVPLKIKLWLIGFTLTYIPFHSWINKFVKWIFPLSPDMDNPLIHQFRLGLELCKTRMLVPPKVYKNKEFIKIKTPTLAVFGDQEMLYDPVKASNKAKNNLPNARVELLEKSGHVLTFDNPEKANQLMMEFLLS